MTAVWKIAAVAGCALALWSCGESGVRSTVASRNDSWRPPRPPATSRRSPSCSRQAPTRTRSCAWATTTSPVVSRPVSASRTKARDDRDRQGDAEVWRRPQRGVGYECAKRPERVGVQAILLSGRGQAGGIRIRRAAAPRHVPSRAGSGACAGGSRINPRSGGLALVDAVEAQNVEIVHALVEAGVDVNSQPGPGTPLVAAIEARNVALMTYLEEHGAREKP